MKKGSPEAKAWGRKMAAAKAAKKNAISGGAAYKIGKADPKKYRHSYVTLPVFGESKLLVPEWFMKPVGKKGKWKLVSPTSKERNLSQRLGLKSLKMIQKKGMDHSVVVNDSMEVDLSDFSNADIKRIRAHEAEMKEQRNTTFEDKTSVHKQKAKARGRPKKLPKNIAWHKKHKGGDSDSSDDDDFHDAQEENVKINVQEKKKAGRPSKYANDEERKAAKKAQTIASNKKQKQAKEAAAPPKEAAPFTPSELLRQEAQRKKKPSLKEQILSGDQIQFGDEIPLPPKKAAPKKAEDPPKKKQTKKEQEAEFLYNFQHGIISDEHRAHRKEENAKSAIYFAKQKEEAAKEKERIANRTPAEIKKDKDVVEAKKLNKLKEEKLEEKKVLAELGQNNKKYPTFPKIPKGEPANYKLFVPTGLYNPFETEVLGSRLTTSSFDKEINDNNKLILGYYYHLGIDKNERKNVKSDKDGNLFYDNPSDSDTSEKDYGMTGDPNPKKKYKKDRQRKRGKGFFSNPLTKMKKGFNKATKKAFNVVSRPIGKVVKPVGKLVGKIEDTISDSVIKPLTNVADEIGDRVESVGEKILYKDHNFPSAMKSLLLKFGHQSITKAVLKRTPVSGLITGALDAFSLGEFGKKLKPFDELFHLFIELRLEGGKELRLEKNARITLSVAGNKDAKDTESQAIESTELPSDLNLNLVLDRTRNFMGEDKFFGYSASLNNCQDFIVAVLKSNKIGDQQDIVWVKQETEELFKDLPALRKFSHGVTEFGQKLESVGDAIFGGRFGLNRDGGSENDKKINKDDMVAYNPQDTFWWETRIMPEDYGDTDRQAENQRRQLEQAAALEREIAEQARREQAVLAAQAAEQAAINQATYARQVQRDLENTRDDVLGSGIAEDMREQMDRLAAAQALLSIPDRIDFERRQMDRMADDEVAYYMNFGNNAAPEHSFEEAVRRFNPNRFKYTPPKKGGAIGDKRKAQPTPRRRPPPQRRTPYPRNTFLEQYGDDETPDLPDLPPYIPNAEERRLFAADRAAAAALSEPYNALDSLPDNPFLSEEERREGRARDPNYLTTESVGNPQTFDSPEATISAPARQETEFSRAPSTPPPPPRMPPPLERKPKRPRREGGGFSGLGDKGGYGMQGAGTMQNMAEAQARAALNRMYYTEATYQGVHSQIPIKTIRGRGVNDDEEIGWDDIKWGSFTAMFKRFKKSNPQKKKIKNLKDFAKMIKGDKEKYSKNAMKKANFYLNVLL